MNRRESIAARRRGCGRADCGAGDKASDTTHRRAFRLFRRRPGRTLRLEDAINVAAARRTRRGIRPVRREWHFVSVCCDAQIRSLSKASRTFGEASLPVGTTRMTYLRHGRFKTFAAQKHCSFLAKA